MTLRTLGLFVFAAASGAALAARMHRVLSPDRDGWSFDLPALVLLGIVLTAVALGAWRRHSGAMVLLQVALACLLLLPLFELAVAGFDRTARYWFQATFALTVVVPLLARRVAPDPARPRPPWVDGLVVLLPCVALNLLLTGLGVVAAGLLTELVD